MSSASDFIVLILGVGILAELGWIARTLRSIHDELLSSGQSLDEIRQSVHK